MEHATPDRSSEDRAQALTALAEIDSHLREGECAWKAVVRKLDASRRELAVAAVQVQMTRSLAGRQSRRKDDESDGRHRPDFGLAEEAHYTGLLQEFEVELTDAEARRVALHGETERLRQRKQAALRQLSAPVRSAYEAALHEGRVPAITVVVDGACRACASRVPPAVVEASGREAVVMCGGCGALLCPTPAG